MIQSLSAQIFIFISVSIFLFSDSIQSTAHSPNDNNCDSDVGIARIHPLSTTNGIMGSSMFNFATSNNSLVNISKTMSNNNASIADSTTNTSGITDTSHDRSQDHEHNDNNHALPGHSTQPPCSSSLINMVDEECASQKVLHYEECILCVADEESHPHTPGNTLAVNKVISTQQSQDMLNEADKEAIELSQFRRYTPPPGAPPSISMVIKKFIPIGRHKDLNQAMVGGQSYGHKPDTKHGGSSDGIVHKQNGAAMEGQRYQYTPPSVSSVHMAVPHLHEHEHEPQIESQLRGHTPKPGLPPSVHMVVEESIVPKHESAHMFENNGHINEGQLRGTTPPPGLHSPIHKAAQKSIPSYQSQRLDKDYNNLVTEG